MSEEIDDEPLILGSEAMEALQSVLGVGLDQSAISNLIESKRWAYQCDEVDEEDEDEQENDDNVLPSRETHAEYYKRLYPERYMKTTTDDGGTSLNNYQVINPVRISSPCATRHFYQYLTSSRLLSLQ
jgi:hypothetical protein